MVPIKPTPLKELRHARRLKLRKLSLKLMEKEKEKEMVMINQRNQHSLPPVVSANHQLSTELTHALLTINAMVPIKPTPLKEPRHARRLKLRKLSLKLMEKEKVMVMINQRNQHSLPPVVSANHQLSTELTHALLTINAMV